MSELQEIIASNSVKAFNNGYDCGVREAQERIIKLLEEANEDGEWRLWAGIQLIKGEQK